MYNKLIQLFKSSSGYTVGSVVSRALFLISMPIMTRYLSPREYGILAIVNAIIAILMTFYGLAAGDFAMRYYYEHDSEQERKNLLGTLVVFSTAFTLGVTVILTCFGKYLFAPILQEIPFYPYLLIGLWTCFFHTIELVPDALFRIRNEVKRFVAVSLFKSAFSICLSIYAVVVLGWGAEGPISATLITNIAVGMFFVYYLRNKIRLTISWQIIRECLRFSTPILFLLLGYVLLETSDRLIMQMFVDLSVVGYYSIGTTLSSVLVMIAASIDNAYAPFFYDTAKNEKKETTKEILSLASLYILSTIIFIGICPIILRHEIVYILAPISYYPVIDIIPLIMIGGIFSGLFFIPARGLYLEKKTIYLPIIISSGLITNIGLNFLLIPLFGAHGAAVATALASFTMLVICYFVSQKIYPIAYLAKRIAKVVMAGAICCLLSLLNFDQSLVLSLPINLGILAIFPLILTISGFFDKRELHKITDILNRTTPVLKPFLNKIRF